MNAFYTLFFTLLTCLPAAIFAQVTDVSAEVFAVHEGMVGEYDLTGYTTYRVYVNFENETDFLTAVYGFLGEDEGPDDEDLAVYLNGNCFDELNFGAGLVPNSPEQVVEVSPALAYDSFFTIDKVWTDDPGTVTAVVADGENFDNFCGSFIDDGAIFTNIGQPNGYAGPDHKILIAQITTDASFDMDFCTQVFANGSQDNETLLCWSLTNVLGGCTDPSAENYDPLATVEDGNCSYPVVLGCTDAEACNYVAEATDDDGSCTYPDESYLDCEGNCLNDSDGDGICNELEIAGCTDEEACNYVAEATDEDMSCTYPGCMDEEACNFDPEAACGDDELCFYVTPYSIEGDDEVQVFALQTYTYQETSGSTYAWSVSGGNIISGQGSATIEVEYTETGASLITVTETLEPSACVGPTVTKEIVVTPATNVMETDITAAIEVYPNPTSSLINVVTNKRPDRLSVVDFNGRQVIALENIQSDRVQLDLNHLASGIYLVQIDSRGVITSRKIILNK